MPLSEATEYLIVLMEKPGEGFLTHPMGCNATQSSRLQGSKLSYREILLPCK